MNRGFTLIELLIVVAIVAILSAVAVPNFLEAQTRSRVARGQSDLRTLATAMEAYAADQSRYPAYGHPQDLALIAGSAIVFTPLRLTTPVAYLSTLPLDGFPGQRTGIAPEVRTPYYYLNNEEVTYLGKYQEPGHIALHYETLTGEKRAVEWTVWSYGPDLADNHGIVQYDATNGTISRGDLMRFGP